LPDRPPQLRAFVALTPDPPWADALAQIQTALSSLAGARQIRWTRPAQIHLTLRFLGNIAPAQLRNAGELLQLACCGFSPFALELDGLGCFPNPQRPGIIWAGLRGAVATLLALQDSVRRAFVAFGDHEETKPFQPHLTIGRVNSGGRPREVPADVLRMALPQAGPWLVSSVELMRSELKASGALHSVLFTQPLSGAIATPQ
jgi:2'-5' RNA ligase